jgi:hypothetical protein
MENWEAVPCPGDGKILPAKRGTDSFFGRGILNFFSGYWKSCCNYQGYLGLDGVPFRKSGEPAGDKKYPADFGRQNSAVPWTTREAVYIIG